MESFDNQTNNLTQHTQMTWVVGEPSGDLLAASIMRAMPDSFRHAGVGGIKMQEVPRFNLWHDSETLAVNGLTDVLRNYRRLLALRRDVKKRVLQQMPSVFCGVDSPDFNLKLERAVRQPKIKTVHVVSPTIWAWRPGRIKLIKDSVDLMLVLFPFEKTIYQQAGIRVQCIGHPMADEIPVEPDILGARKSLGLPEGHTWVALLPGSRLGELRHHVRTMIETAFEIAKRVPKVAFLLPLVSETHRQVVERFLVRGFRKHPAMMEKLFIFVGQSRRVIEASDVCLVASGTATLEAALYKKPMTVMYRMGNLSWQLLHRMVKAPHVAMPNLLLNERVFPEWLQDEATPSNLTDSLLKQLDDLRLREQYKDRLTELHFSLKLGAGGLARDAILELLNTKK